MKQSKSAMTLSLQSATRETVTRKYVSRHREKFQFNESQERQQMAMRLIQVQHLGSDDVTDWYSDVIPQIGETVRLDNNQHGTHYRVINVIHRLWPELLRAESIPIIVLAEIASEVPDAAQDE